MNTTDTVLSGSLLLAVPIALLAGLVSFASPCVLPLVPGFLSYVTGLTGVDLAQQRRGRMLVGAALFVAGFSVVFVSAGVLVGSFGLFLVEHQHVLQQVLGVVTIALGLTFAGVLPWFERDLRVRRRPAVGLVGAPLLGALFGLGWSPCVGPTLTAVLALALDDGSPARGGFLAAAYCLGLGIPFLVIALSFRKAMGALDVVRRHYVWVMRIGGLLLVTIGVLLVTGVWSDLTVRAQVWVNDFVPAV